MEEILWQDIVKWLGKGGKYTAAMVYIICLHFFFLYSGISTIIIIRLHKIIKQHIPRYKILRKQNKSDDIELKEMVCPNHLTSQIGDWDCEKCNAAAIYNSAIRKARLVISSIRFKVISDLDNLDISEGEKKSLIERVKFHFGEEDLFMMENQFKSYLSNRQQYERHL